MNGSCCCSCDNVPETCGCFSVVVGGDQNHDQSLCGSVIVGGSYNTTRGAYSNIVGGNNNNAIGNYTFIGSGMSNHACGYFSGILGGANNLIPANVCNSFIVGSAITATQSNTTYTNNLCTIGTTSTTRLVLANIPTAPVGPSGTVWRDVSFGNMLRVVP